MDQVEITSLAVGGGVILLVSLIVIFGSKMGRRGRYRSAATASSGAILPFGGDVASPSCESANSGDGDC